ncbi:phage tail tape measure protein [Lysobacter sp. K5869]|uniref:phage tail tape measure protein n=1 Tax=Lysobacter sp. K5869 TaxID=2820808 RepID=UPI001C06418F|nr:phage tail tape measure protein [Lysobacter sp. K5869]QWP76074.1 phage tail tape measure protein [Lysobacter sp. K5869]
MSGGDLALKLRLDVLDRTTKPMQQVAAAAQAASRALRETQDKLKGLERAQQQIAGFRRLKNETDASGLALKAAQQKLNAMRGEMQRVGVASERMSRDYAKAERATERLRSAHIRKLQALKSAREGLAASGVEVKRLGEHERRLAHDVAQTTQRVAAQRAELGRLSQQARQAQAAQQRMARSQQRAGALAGAGAGIGAAGATLAAPVAFAVRSYSSFEDAMTGVARQVAGTRDEFGKLTPLYYEMGRELQALSERLPGTAEELAAIAEGAARMGVQGKDNILAFTKSVSILADAFNLPTDEIGESMGKIANLYKIPIANIDDLGDAINYLDDNAQSQGRDIIEVMQRLGGVADKLNYKQAAALGSTFLSLGSAPEVAASAANAMVRELAVATMQGKRFQQGLRALGLDADAVQQRMVNDAQGTILSVLKAIKSLPGKDQLTVTTQLFGKEFGDDAAKLANNLKEYEKQIALTESAKARGSAQREASARANNLSAIWANARDTGRNFASDAGALLAPELRGLGDQLKGATQAARAWIAANPAMAAGLVKAAAAGAVLLSVVGGLALVLAGLLGPLAVIRYGLASLGPALTQAQTALSGLGGRVLPLLMNGARALLPVLGGLSAPVLALLAVLAAVALAVWKYWAPIKAFFIGLWAGFSDALRPVLAELAPLGAILADALSPLRPLWEAVGAALAVVGGWVRDLFTPFQATADQLAGATANGRAFGAVLGSFVAGQVRAVIAVVTTLAGWFKTLFAYSPLGLIAANWDALRGYFVGLWAALQNIVRGGWNVLVGVFTGDGARLRDALGMLWNGINGVFLGWPARFVQFGADMVQGLINGVLGRLDALKSTVTNVAGNVAGWFAKRLDIRSPSRVFARFGDHTMTGLAVGLDRSQSAPLAALTRVTGGMQRAGAALALTTAATAPAVAIDQRPPLAPRAAAVSAAPPPAPIEIHIHVRDTDTGQAIAAAVRAELERIERERAARQRSTYADYD